MQFQELIILLPCHSSLEEFPTHHDGEEADGLLANWTALWHPALIAAAGSAPTWARVDDPPSELQDRLLLVPSASMDQLPTGFPQRAKNEGACLIRKLSERGEILSRAFEALDEPAVIDEEVVADFLALGFCFLQIRLLTRYRASNLDETHFNSQLVAGAQAAATGDVELARNKLSACFDLLAEDRDHYYPVDIYVIDLLLTAEQTLPGLKNELESSTPCNLLMPAEVIGQLAERDSQTREALIQAITEERVALIGGEDTSLRLPLLSCESVLRELRRGMSKSEALLGSRVNVYGRRRFGLTPFLPQVLDKLGFDGALHATMDDGRFPEHTEPRTTWEGADGTAIDVVARAPLDASNPKTFLELASKLSESIDHDHVATVMLARWPGHSSIWHDDLRRCTKYGSVLGKFVTLETYFRDTDLQEYGQRFEADQYKSPYCKQAIIRGEPNPLSTVQRYWKRQVTATAIESLATLASLIRGRPCAVLSDPLLESIDLSSEEKDAENTSIDQELSSQLASAQTAFAEGLPKAAGDPQDGYLVMNPFSVVRRVGVETPALTTLPSVEKPIYSASETESSKYVVVDVPPMGFVWVAPGQPSRKPKPAPLLIDDQRSQEGAVVLRNEFLEASINPVTGAMTSLKDYSKHGNRLSQQLGLRTPGQRGAAGDSWSNPDEKAVYSVMAADSIQVSHATSTFGEVEVVGRLLDREGKLQANYRETFRLWRGTRVLHLEATIEPEVEPAADPWNSYYACRFAWSDETSQLSRGVNQCHHEASRRQLDAPLYIDIHNGEINTTILTGGLPYHRRVGERMLDTLLGVRGEHQHTFHLGIGVDVQHPHHEALSLLAPTTALHQSSPPPQAGTSRYLFHIDARNIAATHWEPTIEEGKVAGFRVRLLETGGRPARARLSAFLPIASARHTDFTGQSRGECQINEGRVQLELAANEWLEVEVLWE